MRLYEKKKNKPTKTNKPKTPNNSHLGGSEHLGSRRGMRLGRTPLYRREFYMDGNTLWQEQGVVHKRNLKRYKPAERGSYMCGQRKTKANKQNVHIKKWKFYRAQKIEHAPSHFSFMASLVWLKNKLSKPSLNPIYLQSYLTLKN